MNLSGDIGVFRRVKIAKVNYIRCLVKKSQTEMLENDNKGQATFNYIEKITNDAGLNTKFAWDGNEVRIMGFTLKTLTK